MCARVCVCTVMDRRVSRTPSARVCVGSEISCGAVHRCFSSARRVNKNFSDESAVLPLFFSKTMIDNRTAIFHSPFALVVASLPSTARGEEFRDGKFSATACEMSQKDAILRTSSFFIRCPRVYPSPTS